MKTKTKDLIKHLALFIDNDKYNSLLLSRNYNEYLEKILTVLVENAISIELNPKVKLKKEK